MFTLFVILTILTSLLLIGVVLIQKSKGGGLSSSFAGSNQIMGVRRTNSFIEKLTWGLAGAICLLSILATFSMPKAINSNASRVNAAPTEQVVPGNFNTEAPAAEAPAAAPQAPAETPAE